MTDTESTPDVRRILNRLGRLRARIRLIWTTIGASRWIVAALGLLALFFAADWLLDLPLGVRRFVRLGLLHPPAGMSLFLLVPLLILSAVFAVTLTRARHGAAPFFAFVTAGLAGLLLWLAHRFFFPLRVRLPNSQLVLSVEARFRHLKDRLAAALDFERELRSPTRGESADMMRAVVTEAAEEARSLRFSQAITGRRALQWAGAAVLAVVVAVGVTSLFGDTVGLWARRSLLLADESWPRETTMVAVEIGPDGSVTPRDPTRPYAVAIGRSLTIYALARGEVPDEALVLDLVENQQPLARRMFRVPSQEGVFAYEFRDVRRPFAFVLQGGDDADERPRYEVEITIPPRVMKIESTISYPEYLGREDEVLETGSVTVPEGSSVRVRFEADVEIASAEVALGGEQVVAAPVGNTKGRGFTFAYRAERTLRYRLVLRTPDGKLNDSSADSYEVRVEPDRPPRVDWIYPRTAVEVTPKGRVPLLARTVDDHGVAGLVLQVRHGFREEVTSYVLTPYDPSEGGERSDVGPPRAVNDGGYGRRVVLTYLPVEIARLRDPEGGKLEAPAEVAFRLVARDSRGQTRESDWSRVTIGKPVPLERSLATQRANVRLAVELVKRDQTARLEEVRELLKGPIGRAELDQLKSIRFAQGKIAQDADRAMRELFAVFNGFVYDRLGSPNANARILAFLDRHHRATYGLEDTGEPPPDGANTGAFREWKGDPVFPYALYRAIVAAWRSKTIYDKGLLDKMCAVLADAVDVGSTLAPRAQVAAAKAVSGVRDDLLALEAAQEANLAALEALGRSMGSWRKLSDLTNDLRSLIEEQEALIRQMDRKPDGRPPEDEGPRER